VTPSKDELLSLPLGGDD